MLKIKSEIRNPVHIVSQKKIVFSLYLFLIIVMFWNCANPGYPEGGPVDKTPPVLKEAIPEEATVRFNKEKFILIFDENIDLKNFEDEFLCSPPLKERPDVIVSGKKVTFNINNILDSNITYHFQFGNSIVDLTENNPCTGFEYVLSTGDLIDSMSLKGRVYNAVTQKPEEKVWVMLYPYETYVDSLVTSQLPLYITKTDKEGQFSFKYIANTTYKVFALKDINRNFFYDLITEGVGFLSEEIRPQLYKKEQSGLDADSNSKSKDSIPFNLAIKDSIEKDTFQVQLALFYAEDTNQTILSSDFVAEGVVRIATKLPVKDLQWDSNPQPLCFEQNVKKDTHTFWLPSENHDSILLILKDGTTIIDTVREKYNKNTITKDKILPFVTSNIKPVFPYYDSLMLFFLSPIDSIDSHAILVLSETDSLVPFYIDSVEVDSTEPEQMVPFVDTLYPEYYFIDGSCSKKIRINFNPEEDKNYKILIIGKRFTSIYGEKNDTLEYPFKISQPKDYGSFIFSFEGKPDQAYLIQFMTKSDEKIIQEDWIEGTKTLRYENLNPGEYKIKVIEDLDRNKRWSSGHFWKHIQPEKIKEFPKPISIRANWDLEESFQWDPQPVLLEKPDPEKRED